MTSIQLSRADSPSAHPSKQPTFQTVRVCFEGDKKIHLDRQVLIQGCAFFKSNLQSQFHESVSGIVELSHISYPVFQVVFRFLCEGTTLSDAITEQDLTPRFYKDLMDALNFLDPLEEPEKAVSAALISPSKARENQVKETLPHLVTYEQAKTILATFRKESAVSSSSSSKEEIPFLVKVAHSIIFQSVTFSTKKLASEHFRSMREAQIRKDQALHLVKQAKPKTAGGSDLLWEDELNAFRQEQIAEESAVLSRHGWKMYPECVDNNLAAVVEKLSPKMTLNCSSYLNDDDPFIREIAALAKQRLTQEVDTTVTALLDCGIDLSKNPTLRDHLVGPKANLLANYDIGVVTDAVRHSRSRLPFRINNNTPWTCDFNQSPKAFEDELRQDLKLMGYELGPRLIEKDEEPSSQPVKEIAQGNAVVQALYRFKTEISASSDSLPSPVEYAESKRIFLSRHVLHPKTKIADCVKELDKLSRKNRLTIEARLCRSSKSASIQILFDDTVATVKKKVIEEFKLTQRYTHLIHKGTLLQPDTRPMNNFNLKPGDIVHVRSSFCSCGRD